MGAFRDAAAVVHLAGALQPRKPDTYSEANVGTALATAAALTGSSVERVVFLSFTTASAESKNEYLRDKARAEEALAASAVPSVIFRCNHIFGPPDAPGPTASAFLAKRGAVRVLGNGKQRLAPIFRDDVADVLVAAALDVDTPTGTFQLAGPETMSAAEFARKLGAGRHVRVRGTSKYFARLLGHVSSELTPALVDVMRKDCDPPLSALATASHFGVTLHTVADVWGNGQSASAAGPWRRGHTMSA